MFRALFWNINGFLSESSVRKKPVAQRQQAFFTPGTLWLSRLAFQTIQDSREAEDGLIPVEFNYRVRTYLSLATLSVQIAMIVNTVRGLPLHNISVMTSAFT
jgi:hypothetical protein